MNHSSFWSPLLKQWRDWSTCYTRDWEHQDSSARGTGNYGKIFILCENTWWESVKNTEPNISQWYPVNEQEARDTKSKQTKKSMQTKEKTLLFHNSEGSQILAQFFQQAYGVCILGDTQDTAGPQPWPACSDWAACSGWACSGQDRG